MDEILLFTVALALGVGVVSLTVIKLMGNPGNVGMITTNVVGGSILLVGVSFIAFQLYNYLFRSGWPYPVINGFFVMILPGVMIWFGWRWLRYEGMDIEGQQIDLSSEKMIDSMRNAQKNLSVFIGQVRNHVDEAYLKFPFHTTSGNIEHVWAYVHGYENRKFNVSITNDLFTEEESDYHARRDVPETDVEDWQIFLPDGNIQGAYSSIGAFQYLENRGIKLNRALLKRKRRLVDWESRSHSYLAP